jgi:putative transposase
MLTGPLSRLRSAARRMAAAIRRRISRWTQPTPLAVAVGAAADAARCRRDLVLENALLRQQLLVLHRQSKRPRLTTGDRGLLVLLAGRLPTWAHALVIVQPATVLRWHRQGFRLFWRRKSAPRATASRIPTETIALIRRMAAENWLWGADRIRGELLKLDVRVSKRTIQKYTRSPRPPRSTGQRWATFLRNHAPEIWACDFLPVTDLLFRPLFAFFIVELASRRVVHVGVTRHPTDAWVAQQLREATPFDQRPRFLIRDNDAKYGSSFARVAAATGITGLRTAHRAPRQNATCERFLGSVRRECLDHLLILGERHLRRMLGEYVAYFNRARPHQGLAQRIPGPPKADTPHPSKHGIVRALPVLGGLHHTYERAA